MTFVVNSKIAGFKELIAHVLAIWIHVENEYINNPKWLPPTIREKLDIGMNIHALSEAVENARIDLSRWTEFHLSDKQSLPDNHKYAGFLSKWIAKNRPIYVKDCGLTEELPRDIYQINAIFALAVFRSYLIHDIPVFLAREMMYRLHFRDDSGENLAFAAFCCENLEDC